MNINIPDFVFNKKRQPILSDDTVGITRNGKDAVEKGSVFGGIKGRVLNKIYDRGEITIKEISNETGIPVETVKDVILHLNNKNYIKKVGFND